jgi:PPK2 family polyphosphate:nucleotide phosphotransferase
MTSLASDPHCTDPGAPGILPPMNLSEKLLVKPGQKVALSEIDPDGTPGYRSKPDVAALLERNTARLAELQYLLYAENKRALLVVLQAVDAGGKDGTIRHVMSGLNPQGCRVKSFKAPSVEELDHDFLWRVHPAVPPKGEVGIFNRSHYEDVIAVRVHKLRPRPVWERRYDEINAFERHLVENDIAILKFFLHISKDEQRKRIQARIDDPRRRWKLSPADFEERKYWDETQVAYEDALSRCSKPDAPWFIVPANKKWYRNAAVSSIIVEALESMRMKFPKPSFDLSRYKLR